MENVDVIRNSQHVGVSSFGFGGTNARADLWGYCQEGFRGEALASFVSWLHSSRVAFLGSEAAFFVGVSI